MLPVDIALWLLASKLTWLVSLAGPAASLLLAVGISTLAYSRSLESRLAPASLFFTDNVI